MKKYIPDLITSLRIAGTVALLFLAPLSMPFLVVYTLCGASDVLDGFLARRWKLESAFGARLDSVADILFYAVMLYSLFPLLVELLPLGCWYGIGAVILLRLASYITAAVKYHCFAAVHTYANKITGFVIFSVPYLITNVDMGVVGTLACLVAGAASFEEWMIHLFSREYRGNARTIFSIGRRRIDRESF